MYWLCIDCKAIYDNSAPWDTPPTQLTLQKIGVPVAFVCNWIIFCFIGIDLSKIFSGKYNFEKSYSAQKIRLDFGVCRKKNSCLNWANTAHVKVVVASFMQPRAEYRFALSAL